jgi:hypothetical protein
VSTQTIIVLGIIISIDRPFSRAITESNVDAFHFCNATDLRCNDSLVVRWNEQLRAILPFASHRLFNMKHGASGRLTGAVIVVAEVAMFLLPSSPVQYVPNFFFGGLMLWLGIDIMYDWLVRPETPSLLPHLWSMTHH